MTEQSSMPEATSGAPEDGVIAAGLLEQLRAEAGSDLEFLEPPAQLQGGFETFTYGFKVSAQSGPFSGPLILRVFREKGKGEQGRREAAFQNALAGLGSPVPCVLLQVGSPGIEGRPFNVMERVAGRPMMADIFEGTMSLESMIGQLAGVQARLHEIPSAPVIEAVGEEGFDVDAFSIWNRLEWVGLYFEDPAFDDLKPGWAWLLANRPDERAELSVCHGDFHPGNVMFEDGAVSGVIDWPGAAFADFEHDVAVTVVLMGIVAGGLFPEGRDDLQGFRSAYIGAYEQHQALDHARLEYYEVLRMFIGFVRGTASLTEGVNPELVPRGGYPWADAWVMKQGAARIEEITGLALPLPEGIS